MSKNKKYFGTDGIRGKYGEKLTDELAYKCGNVLGKRAAGGKIILGRDTRESGEALVKGIKEGVKDAGGTVIDLGIVSTPAVAYVTEVEGAKYGIVISASHNPKEYNGIKLFNGEGRKLTDDEELAVEKDIDGGLYFGSEGKEKHGAAELEQYYGLLKKVGGDLSGIKVGLDCANGAASMSAARIFAELGAEVTAINAEGDGKRINEHSGALYPEVICRVVAEQKLDIGFSFDGDADRVLCSDENGRLVDGDAIIYIIAVKLKNEGRLNGNLAVGTHHTNMGVEQSLAEKGIRLERTDIGDHYVAERMREKDSLVGGEQSGHIILREFSGTGDGLLTALYLTSVLKNSGKRISELADNKVFPQVNLTIECADNKKVVADADVQEAARQVSKRLEGKGRLLLRASGTEPKIRIMTECDSYETGKAEAEWLKSFIEQKLGLKK